MTEIATVTNIADWQKEKKPPAYTSTDALNLADIQQSLEQIKELIAEQNKIKYETSPEVMPKPDIHLSDPIQFFLKLIEIWRMNTEEACKLLGYELSDIEYVKQLLSGVSPLRGHDLKDRIANLLVIRKRLSGIFQDIDVENEWLHEKHDRIGNKSPMELLLSGSMENLLLVKQFVEFVCGL